MDWAGLARQLPAAAGVNLGLALVAYRLGGVRLSGVLGGLLVGIPIWLFLGWRGFSVLVAMYVVGTALTRLDYARKERLGVAEDRKGARGASHAFANAGVAVLCALGSWIWPHPLWVVGFTGALATAAMDTAGSEVGPLWGRRTISLKTFRSVRPGTEGAVSLEGTLAGILVAGILGALARAVGLLLWPNVAAVVAGAWVGNLYEGILGSRRLLPHTWLNATNTLVGAAAATALALLWGR
jgi:uncharacterized protein (TIGR00297 family)